MSFAFSNTTKKGGEKGLERERVREIGGMEGGKEERERPEPKKNRKANRAWPGHPVQGSHHPYLLPPPNSTVLLLPGISTHSGRIGRSFPP